jgi:hypothetical protein
MLCIRRSFPSYCALALLLVGVVPGAEKFKIAIIPDTQELTQLKNQHMSYSAVGPGMNCFYAQTAWLRGEAAHENIVFATHLGDLWQSHGSDEVINFQASAASTALYVLHGVVPYSTVPGNHDYDRNTTAPGFDQTPGKPHWRPKVIDGLKLYGSHFGLESSHFRNQPWYLDAFRIGNSATTFTAGGYEFIHIGLEMEPDDNVLDWAQSVVDRHPRKPTIVTTHAYMAGWNHDFIREDPNGYMASHFPEHLVQRNGELYSYGRLNEYYRYSFPNNTPEQVWQKLIRKNDQIFMVLSGHNFDWASDTGETLRVDLNEAGHPVYQFCIDYQYRNSLYSEPRPHGGGDGWMRLMEFDIDRGLIRQITYSPALGQYETDRNSSYAIPVDFQARFAPANQTRLPPAKRR